MQWRQLQGLFCMSRVRPKCFLSLAYRGAATFLSLAIHFPTHVIGVLTYLSYTNLDILLPYDSQSRARLAECRDSGLEARPLLEAASGESGVSDVCCQRWRWYGQLE